MNWIQRNGIPLAAFGWLMSCLAGCSETSNSPEILIERARRLERQGKLTEAAEAYGGAIEKRPSDAMLHYDRGVVYGQLEQFDLAIREYTRAIELDPALARAFNNRAVAYAQKKDYEKAIKDCDRAIDLDPNDALAYRNRGLAYHDLSLFDKALADYDTSIRNDGRSAVSYFHRGNVYLEMKKFDRAIEDFDQAVRLDAKHALAYQNRAIAYASSGRREPAERDFAAAKRLDSKLEPAWPTESSGPAAEAAPSGIQQVSASVPAPPVTGPPEAALLARAIEATAEHLEASGVRVQLNGQSEPWPIRCVPENAEFHVLVKLADLNDPNSVELSDSEITAVRDSKIPVRLAIVSRIGVVEASNKSGRGGSGDLLVKLLNPNWLDDAQLKPTRFRLSVKSAQPE